MALCTVNFVETSVFLFIFVIFSVIFTDYCLFAHQIVTESISSPEFAKHMLIKPKIYHGREKRQISTTKENDGTHTHDLVIGYDIDGIDYILDLRLNRELIPKGYFQRHQQNGKHVINRPTGKDIELCQYQGTIRGINDSWVALSTCHKGLSGVIYDGNELHYLERVNSTNIDSEGFSGDLHYLFKHSDLIDRQNKTCGYKSVTSHFMTPSFHSESDHILENNEINRILRYKRSTHNKNSNIRGPFNANKRSRYVELVMVVDQQEYKHLGENINRANNRCKDIANIINALYAPLNIFIALTGVVVWTETDEIKLVDDGDKTLTSFLHYRREKLVKEHPNDNAQLLTHMQFTGGVVGKALKGTICTYEFSGGVSMDHSQTVGLVATTIAHEMGHNFGMEHDTNDCKCPDERCIMAPSSSSLSPKHWSSCSLEYLAHAFEHGMDYCLRNKPDRLFDSPICGNGFVEPGEQCDCGLVENCKNPCCNATTCMLHSNATCATGECCDLTTCRPKTAGTLCRSADHECDLPEYCTGQSEYCPNDVYKMDTETCDGGKAFCYQGSCRTRNDQCKLLWGPSGQSSDECYNLNSKGNRHGNCGYNRLNASYIKCKDDHVYCGMLHCRHLNEKLEFGVESVAILSHSFINSRGSIIPCRNAILDLGLNEVDPGLTPDGAKCGEGKMCVSQKCMPVDSLRKSSVMTCEDNCNGNGYCNSKGHCHCKDGFAPPRCDYPGVGGSVDSGPASNPNANREFITAMYIIFLGIIPFMAIISLLLYYVRHNSPIFWPKRSNKKFKSPPKPHRGHIGFQAPQTIEVNSRNDDNSSLLSNSDTPIIPPAPPGFNNNFFGHFKGFIITPITKSSVATVHAKNATVNVESPLVKSENKLPQRLAPPIPTVPNVTIKSPKFVNRSNTTQGNKPVLSVKPTITRSNTVARPSTNSVSNAVSVINATSVAPALPPLNPGSNARPLISDPILENSTCTAKELISPLKNAPKMPMRPAPEVPNPIGAPTSPHNKRPLSSPNSVTNSITSQSQEEPNKKTKDGPGSALNRIASFLKSKDDKNKVVSGTNSLPRTAHHGVKANKILDKTQLKNIEISNPIPQTEIEIAANAVPVDSVKDKNVVMRAQSMRGGQITHRPNIPTFGSMRQPNYAKRPTSIPVANRPTSPPPPRPPQPDIAKTSQPSIFKNSFMKKIPGLPGYQQPQSSKLLKTTTENSYDDCVSGSKVAGDAVTPSSTDNIYAVIEESPTSKETETSSSSASSEYKSPKPLEHRSNSGSSESMGLLGEIVSEIQNRNFDSIYSTSTLARKKKENAKANKIGSKSDDENEESANSFPDKNSVLVSSDSSLGTYVNTSSIYKTPESTYSNMNPRTSSANSTTSSGYLHPSAVNAPVLKTNTATEPVKPMSTFKGNDESPKEKKTDNSNDRKSFSSTFQRNSGPLAVAYANRNDKKQETDKTKTTVKPTTPTVSTKIEENKLKRQTTPPNLKRQVTPPNMKNQKSSPSLSRQITPPHLKTTQKPPQTNRVVPPKNLPKTGQKLSNNNSPDVVSSCATTSASLVKSPDVINDSSDSQKNSTSPQSSDNKTVTKQLNSSVPSKTSVRQPSPSPPVKNQTIIRKNNTINNKLNSEIKPSIIPKAFQQKSDTNNVNKAMPAAARQAASKLSNVASLQQKFEANKLANTKTPLNQIKRTAAK